MRALFSVLTQENQRVFRYLLSMDAKKKKKSKKELIEEAIDQLQVEDPDSILGPLVSFEHNKDTSVDKAMLNLGGNAAGSNLNETRTMPSGMEGATAIYEAVKLEADEELPVHKLPQNMIPNSDPVFGNASSDEKTAIIGPAPSVNEGATNYEFEQAEKTIVMGGAKNVFSPSNNEKTSVGRGFFQARASSPQNSNSADGRLSQAENLKIAQDRILEIEKELEHLREENEHLSAANTAAKDHIFEISQKAERLEKELVQTAHQYQSELEIFRDSASLKEVELVRSR